MTKVSKRRLAEIVSERAELSVTAASDLVSHVFAAITEELAKGNSVTMTGFGTWRMKVCPPRIGRDLRDGSQISIPPRTRVTFKAGAGLRRTTESSIDPEVFFGQGVPRSTELDSVFARLFGSDAETLDLAKVREQIREAIGANAGAERDAVDFFTALMEHNRTPDSAAADSDEEDEQEAVPLRDSDKPVN